MGIDAEVQLAQGGEILDHLGLRNLRQRQIIAQVGRIRQGRSRNIQARRDHSDAAGHAAVHQQTGGVSVAAFVQHCP